jgi:hypothetical protein
MRSFISTLATGLLLSGLALSVRAGTFSTDFNTGALPAGSHTNANANGGAYLELTGGVGDSGCLKLTKNINSQNGSFILDDLDAGQPIYGFDATFKVRIGGGTSTPADGMSLSVGPSLADTSLFGEGGAGGGLSFDWDIFNNPDNPPSPQINVRVAGGVVAYKSYTIASITTTGDVTTWWADVHIHLNPDGSLNFDYKGVNVFTNFFIPGYQSIANAGFPVRFGFGARTGGANANQWIDNLQITTYTTPMVGISQQPFSQTAQQGDNIQFDVRVANTNGVTYQWFSNNVAIAGATGQALMITNVPAGASGSTYKVTATGPNNAVTSSVATLTVTNLTIPSTPALTFDFNDGATPPAATLTGTAFIDTSGGITNSDCLKLVAPAGSGAIIVTNAADGGAPVFGFTARFKILVGGGTVPPADGFAFAFGSDIPAAPSGNFEEGIGLGTGLIVTFDIYNNDGIFGFVSGEAQPAPSIDVRLGNQVLATRQLPVSFMETGVDPNDGITPLYQDTIVQLNVDGTINVVYHGALVFDHLPIPFSSIAGGRFAIAARTGGLNDNIWIDNFELTTVTTSGAIRITTQPTNQTVLVNHAFTNAVIVNDPTGATYQWYRNGATPVGGATSSSYVIPSVALTDSGATFNVQVTKSSVTVTSTPALLTVANLTAPVSPNLTFNFDDALLPPNTAIYSGAGGGYISPNGGVGDSGVLHITDAANGESGAFVVSNLYNGAQVSAIAASWDVRLGGGSGNPADGYSFNFANNLTAGVSGGENGNGNGISVCFDIYGTLADNPPAPNVNIRYKGALVASTQVPKPDLETGSGFRTVLLRVDPDGKLYLAYGERVFYNGLQLPNYTFTSAGKFGFYGRTGGENENQWIDNIQIKATQSSGPLTITAQPADAIVLAGSNATFTVGLSDPNGASYQWSKNGVNIGGATASSYTTPPTVVGDSGSTFKVVATSPSGTATSSNALLTVVAPITITSPNIAFDFNDCALPPGTTLNGAGGGGYVDCSGGITNSGVLKLTDAVNGEGGTFIMPDADNNQPIKAVTAYFAIRVADGTTPPADGFSFVWAPSNNIPNSVVFGQNGIGNGLIVGFDTYLNNNADPEAPSFNIWWNGVQIVKKLVSIDALETGGYNADPLLQYADVFIRVNTNGTLDLQYHGNVIFNHVVLPGYAAIAGGEFAIGGATGGLNETHWVDNIQIATTVGLVPPTLGFSRVGNGLKLTWGDGFKLQSTPSLKSPVTWTDVSGATSPYTANPTGAAQFFRLAPTP